MAEIINFSHEEEMPDLDGMSRDQLLAWLREIREQIGNGCGRRCGGRMPDTSEITTAACPTAG